MRQPKFDPSKPCSWCNPCPSSHCDCCECSNKECAICYKDAADKTHLATGFRWNRVPLETARFWDPAANDNTGGEILKTPESDLQLVKNCNQARYEDTLRALCRVVAELAEIEEQREKEKA